MHHIARRHPSYGNLGNDAFQIAHQMQLVANQFLKLRFAEKVIHHIQTLVDRFFVFQRKQYPTAHQAGAHRGNRTVYHAQQRITTVYHGIQQLQIAHREFIQTDITFFFNTRNGRDMSDLAVLGHL